MNLAIQYVDSRDNELVAGTHGLNVFVLDISPIRKQVNGAGAAAIC